MAAIIALSSAQQELQAEEERRRRRITLACAYCRYRKIRCDGAPVCKNCVEGSWKCEYVKVSAEENRAARERKAQSKARQNTKASSDESARSTPARAPRRTSSTSKRTSSVSLKRTAPLATSSSAPSLTPITIHNNHSHEQTTWHAYHHPSATPLTGSSCPSPYTPSVLALSSQSQPPSLTPSTASTSPNSSFASFESYPHPHSHQHQMSHHSMPATPYEHFGGSGPHDAVWGPPSPPEDAEVASWEEHLPYPHPHSLPPPHQPIPVHHIGMGVVGPQAQAGYEMDVPHYLPHHHPSAVHAASWERSDPDMSAFKMYFDPTSRDAPHPSCGGANSEAYPHPQHPHGQHYVDQHGQPLSIVTMGGAYPTPIATPTMGPDEAVVCFSDGGQGIVRILPQSQGPDSDEYDYDYSEHDHHRQQEQQQHFAPPPQPMNVSGWDAPLVPADESSGTQSSSASASVHGQDDYENLVPISPVLAVLEPEQDGYVDEPLSTPSLH